MPDHRALTGLAIAVVVLTACHVYYLVNSRIPPSTDEAHYMTGALGIAGGVRSGSQAGAWRGYLDALVYKPPLVCVPAAVFMLATGGSPVLPSMLSLAATFAALGFASYLFFRRCVEPVTAAAASVLLLTTPLVTGLTHRFYVELLLLLVSMLYLAVLARGPWLSWRWSGAAGVLMGLGLLTKITFPVLLAAPTAWSLAVAAGPRAGLRKRLPGILARLAFALLAGIAVAAPWYGRNFASVLHHSKVAASCQGCYYPGWLLADISSGPGVLLWSLGLAGIGALAHAVLRGKVRGPARHAWAMALLLAAATAVALAATVNKATRFQVTWLPAIVLLAAALPAYTMPRRAGRYCLGAIAALSAVISLHISFELLPFRALRWGDLRVFDSRFPMNVPGWFDDNHPLDRRRFPLDDVVPIIASDAAHRLRRGETVQVRLAEMGLLVNHEYLALLSMARQEAVRYSWWPGTEVAGPAAPDYIVHTRGFRSVYAGDHFFEHYPGLEADIASGRVPYDRVVNLAGWARTEVVVYRKAELVALAGFGGLRIQAESFQRGNAAISTPVILSRSLPVFAEYDFTLDSTGTYQVDVRFASEAPRPVRVLLDGKAVSLRAAGSITGGYDAAHQQWQPVGVMPIGGGRHTLRLESDSALPYIDQFGLVRIDGGTRSNIGGTMRLICSTGALAAMLSVACGPPPTTGPGDRIAVEPNGPTAGLKRMDGQPVYNLEQVAEVLNPFTKPSVAIPAIGQLTVSGWAVDQEGQSSAGGVDVVIDGRPYPAEYKLDRADVAEHFKVPSFASSGFRLSVAAAAIGKGRHRLAVRVISRDGTHYWEGPPLIVEIF